MEQVELPPARDAEPEVAWQAGLYVAHNVGTGRWGYQQTKAFLVAHKWKGNPITPNLSAVKKAVARECGTAAKNQASPVDTSGVARMLGAVDAVNSGRNTRAPSDWVAARDRAMLPTGFFSSARTSMLTAARVENVVFDPSAESVDVTFVAGVKGREPHTVTLWSRDDVLCPVAALRVWIADGLAGARTGPLFPTAPGSDRSIGSAAWNTRLRRLAATAGIDASGYSLRRGSATQAIADGANELDVQAHLGHQDLSTTRGYIDSRSDGFGGVYIPKTAG